MPLSGHFLEKTSARILAIALGIIALFLVFLFAFIFPLVQDALFDSRKMATKNLVDSVCSMVENYHARAENGEITESRAKQAAIERIRSMRFSDNGYIWINDTTRPYPRMVMHPAMPALEGRIMDDAAYKTAVSMQLGMDGREVGFDSEKRHFFKVFLEVARKSGSGFVEYQWRRPTDEGVTEAMYPKKSYVRLFAPWDWVIGTGIYIEDVYAQMNHLKWIIISMAAAIFLISLAGTFLVMRTITQPINRLVGFAEKVAGGETHAQIRGRFSGEMRQLKDAISQMVEELRTRMREAELRAKEAEDARLALKNSEEKYRLIFENSPLGVLHFDQNGVITACNDNFVEIIGSSRNALIGLKMLDLPDQNVVAAVKTALAGGQGFYEGPYESATAGKVSPARVLFAPFRGSSGGILGGVGIIEDITERKEAEEALRQSEEKYRLLVENVREAIFVAQDGMVRYANAAALNLTGYSLPELTSRPFIDFLHPGDRQMVLERHYKRVQGLDVSSDYEFRIIHRSGEVKWGELRGVYVEWEGRPATLNLVVDITEEKKAQQERQELEDRLRHAQKIEALGTLTGGVAHDFNNILSIILGYTELVQAEMADLPEDHPASKGLRQISAAGIRARDVVRQLLTFSRQGEEEKSAQNIGLIIKEGMRMMRSTIPSFIEITEQVRTDLPMVMANPTQIHQLIVNLCKNSSDAMADDGGGLTVSLSPETLEEQIPAFGFDLSPGDYVKLTVSDTGHGIPADGLERVFDPYYTTKDVGKGTGLGLSVVLGIVRDLVGGIRVDSEEGRGSRFEIFLPALREPAETPSPRGREMLPGGTERILFVDDEKAVTSLNELRLQRLGYRVTCETDPEKALQQFSSDPEGFDLLITDMTMRKMTGDVLAGEILKIRPNMKIILCTGYSEKISEQSARRAGIARYLEKPVDLSVMAEAVRAVLDE
ncbi:MAG: PAS domain S-box protein [Desulfobacteraceae bacterium]|nr:PAS domain S-box protein [Desulfobacteraceae bacterium]